MALLLFPASTMCDIPFDYARDVFGGEINVDIIIMDKSVNACITMT